MNAEPQTIDAEDVDMFEHVSEPAGRVVAKAEQSIAARQEQNNAPADRREMTAMEMVGRALEMGVSADILKQMMDLRDREESTRARKAFDEAMAAAKAEIPTINKNRKVGYEHKNGGGETSYRHEDLGEIARVVAPILAKHGLSYRFRTSSEVNQPVSVTCIVSHRAGHFEENTLVAGADNSGKKNSIQAIGSTITYLQRYTLKAALGLAAAADDDGQNADGEPELINSDQLARLREMLDETQSDVAAFCQVGRIESLPDMLAKDFEPAMRMLEQKRARMNQRGAA